MAPASRRMSPVAADGAGGAREDAYDVVVVGGGIGGLTAGALLAKSGTKVLVAEAEPQPGGYASALVRGPYTFDQADHLIWGCEPSGPFGPGVVDAVLRHLGVSDRCEFLRMDDPVYAVRLPGVDLPVPSGREAFLEAHLRLFPRDAAGLRRVVATAAEVYRESRQFPLKAGLGDLAGASWRFPTLFRHRGSTLKEVVDAELSDPRLRSAYTALWSWIGQPPSRASFLMWSVLMTGYVEDGAFVCRGGFQALADALAAGLTQAGGELLLGVPVTSIHVEHGRVHGVELATGQRVRTPLVISTGDARDTFERLVGVDHLSPRFVHRLRHSDLSLSVFVLYAATDLDVAGLGAYRDVNLSLDWDPERTYQRALAGEVTNLSILVPTLADPTLAPPGEHLVILKTVAADQPGLGEQDDTGRAEQMLQVCETVLPDLRRHLTYLDHVDPHARLPSPLHHMGAIYGWSGSPRDTGPRRLPPHTPIRGLLLAGQWTQPGPGICTVMQSGIGAARLALGVATSAPAVPLHLGTG